MGILQSAATPRLSYPAETRSAAVCIRLCANSLMQSFQEPGWWRPASWSADRANNFYALVRIPLVIFMRSVNASRETEEKSRRVCFLSARSRLLHREKHRCALKHRSRPVAPFQGTKMAAPCIDRSLVSSFPSVA